MKINKTNVHLVSIIVPVYNVEIYLEACLDSIIGQSYKNLEVILINDGSTDKSKEICLKYKNKDLRIRFFEQKNGGLSRSRNLGIVRSTGNFITFVDSDDWLEQDYIEKMVREIESNDVDMVEGGMKIQSYRGITKLKSSIPHITCENTNDIILNYIEKKYIPVSACGKLYKKKIFKNIKYPENKINEDLFTMLDILLSCKKIVITDISGYVYRKMGDSITRSDYSIKRLDLLEAHDKQINMLLSYDQKIIDLARIEKMKSIKYLINNIIQSKHWKMFKNDFSYLREELIKEECKICNKTLLLKNKLEFYQSEVEYNAYIRKKLINNYIIELPKKYLKKLINKFGVLRSNRSRRIYEK